MTEYVVTNVDQTVPDYVKVLSELELMTANDTTYSVDFTAEEAQDIQAATPDDLVAKYEDIPLADDGPVVTLNGSGNFHHLTYGMCRGMVDKKGTDYTVFHFDKHGDSRKPGSLIDCGSYLGELVRDSPHARRQVIIGADYMTDNSKWMDNRVLDEQAGIYPYSTADARFVEMDHEPDVDCAARQYNEGVHQLDVTWHTVEDQGIEAITRRALERTDTDAVYITVDLDVLSKEYAATNWGNGRMSLDELLDSIKMIKEEKKVIGLDITGTDPFLEDSSCHTYYSIAAIVNELKDGPYDRSFFHDKIRLERGILRATGVIVD